MTQHTHKARTTCVRWGCALAVLAASAAPETAVACAAPNATASLGSVPSFRIRNGPSLVQSAALTFTCNGNLATVLSAPTLTAKLETPVSGLQLKNTAGTYAIPYQITADNGTLYTNALVLVNLAGAQLLALLSNNVQTVPINIVTSVGPNVPKDTYTGQVQVRWSPRNICQGANVLNACVGVSSNIDVLSTLTITLDVTNDCAIAAPNMVFGTAPLPSGFPTLSQAITLTCTRDMRYTVGLSAGGNPATGRRQMASGSNRLAYNIFKADSTVWGTANDANGTRSSPAVADGITVQTIPYSASIYPDQPAPPVGAYTDNVVVDVQF